MESRFKPGSIVWFQPNIEKIDFKSMTVLDPSTAVKAKVVSVSFTNDKVLYDLALFADGGFYEIFPIKSVDSIFVCPIIEPAKAMTVPPRDNISEKMDFLREDAERIRKERDVSPLRPYEQPFMPRWEEMIKPNQFPPGTIICDVSKLLRNH